MVLGKDVLWFELVCGFASKVFVSIALGDCLKSGFAYKINAVYLSPISVILPA